MTGAGGLSPGGERPPVSLMDLFHKLPAFLMEQALTHPHSVQERAESYERLEFLGDSVLGLAVAARLFRDLPAAPEGTLAKTKAYAVARSSCAVVAESVGLREFILEEAPVDESHRTEMSQNRTLLGNVLEALVGAAFVAFGYETVAEPLADAFAGRVKYALQHTVDYKSTLQEALAAEGQTAVYEVVGESGPPHRRSFTSVVTVRGEMYGKGTGRSIKRSEQAAALEALERLGVLDKGNS